ncbi:serine/threonine kinase [Geitlerinema sp. FC II]|nr:serine/threonine kinase [Geitlerinema sp. FC II]
MCKDKLTAEELQEQYDRGVRDFSSKDFSDENLQGLQIPGTIFNYSNLDNANFIGVNLEKCSIYYCQLNGTIFEKSNLSYGDIHRNSSRYTDFSNSNLSYSQWVHPSYAMSKST